MVNFKILSQGPYRVNIALFMNKFSPNSTAAAVRQIVAELHKAPHVNEQALRELYHSSSCPIMLHGIKTTFSKWYVQDSEVIVLQK